MNKKDLRQFDAKEIAKFDSDMWQAYYKHQFVKLFFILVRFAYKIHKDLGFSYLDVIKAAYYTAYSAMDFRINKGKENKERIVKKLTKAFKLLSDHSTESFDYKRAAELEVEWWIIDRYPSRYQTSREEGIANAMGAIYNISPSKLGEYATARAEAMKLEDKAEEEGTSANWAEIESLLEKSFTSLHTALNK